MPRFERLTKGISIHTPHAGSDTPLCLCPCLDVEFQSTLPMRGATKVQGAIYRRFLISIHTPHAGSDIFTRAHARKKKISIHTPHAGSDETDNELRYRYYLFQSTLPMRGATATFTFTGCRIFQFQSTLPMRGATIPFAVTNVGSGSISIHTPHAGSDISL